MRRKYLTTLLAAGISVWAGAIAADDGGCCSSHQSANAKMPCCNAEPGGTESTPRSCCAGGQAGAGAADAAPTQPAQDAPVGRQGMRGGHGGGAKGAVMRDAMALLHRHGELERTVEEIPKGVRTVTTTDNRDLVALLHKHPQEMYGFYESGGVVRGKDPLFRELARVSDKVDMQFEELENGIEVTVTSDDPEIVKLVRAHAYKVSDFVRRGHAALHEGTELPEGYQPPTD